MPGLKDINQIRAVNFGRGYLWDIFFENIDDPNHPKLPDPWNEWLPANDIEEGVANLTHYKFNTFLSTFSIPQSTNIKELKMTFVDDAAYTLFSFFDQWINKTILNNEQYVSTLSECIKMIHIHKLNKQKEVTITSSYWVVPEGDLTFHGSSASDPHNYSISLVIVGTVEKNEGLNLL